MRYAWQGYSPEPHTAVTKENGTAMGVVFWAWVTVAAILAVGEVLGSGLYLLPFAAGAAAAAIVTALGLSPSVQWIALLVVSSLLTVVIRRTYGRDRNRGGE